MATAPPRPARAPFRSRSSAWAVSPASLRLCVDRQRALLERPRCGKLALSPQQSGEVVEARRRIGMLRAERLLVDRQRALVERSRHCKVALSPQQACEIVEARCRMGMLSAASRSPSRPVCATKLLTLAPQSIVDAAPAIQRAPAGVSGRPGLNVYRLAHGAHRAIWRLLANGY